MKAEIGLNEDRASISTLASWRDVPQSQASCLLLPERLLRRRREGFEPPIIARPHKIGSRVASPLGGDQQAEASEPKLTRGSCFLGVDKHPVAALMGGDFVFLPAPKTYTLRCTPKTRLRSVLEVITPATFHRSRLILWRRRNTSFGRRRVLHLRLSPESELLVKHLPPIIHLPASVPHTTP
jgi:hypothetical protein